MGGGGGGGGPGPVAMALVGVGAWADTWLGCAATTMGVGGCGVLAPAVAVTTIGSIGFQTDSARAVPVSSAAGAGGAGTLRTRIDSMVSARRWRVCAPAVPPAAPCFQSDCRGAATLAKPQLGP